MTNHPNLLIFQAQHIFDRQKKAKEIEKQKDIKEVQRDLNLIRSPAAGMKRPAKEMETDDHDLQEEANTLVDTSISISEKAKVKKRSKVVEVIEEDDAEMEEN